VLANLHTFAISLIIGLLIGLEREHRRPEGIKTIGVRTFVLFALLGTFAALLEHGALAISISLFVFGLILLSYWNASAHRQENPDLGITTEIAAAIVFCLGFMAVQDSMVAAILGSIVLLLLIEKKRLHTFSREQLKPRELEAVGILVAFMLVLPFLPNQTIDIWQLFNPRKFGTLIAIIALIQFGGYVAVRLLGHRLGMSLTGFFGGLVSSTAVFATLPEALRSHPERIRAVMALAILSVTAMLIETSIILFVASSSFFSAVLWPLLSMIVVGSLSAILLLMHATPEDQQAHVHSPRNPLNITSILRLSLFMGAMITLVALARHYVGTEGTLLVSFFGGLFEVHGVTLATALLYSNKILSLPNASNLLAFALLASFVSKFFLLWTLTPVRFALQTSLLLIAMMVTGAIVALSIQII
jgi:uncharacterized membrane protein (DUF4010 family)